MATTTEVKKLTKAEKKALAEKEARRIEKIKKAAAKKRAATMAQRAEEKRLEVSKIPDGFLTRPDLNSKSWKEVKKGVWVWDVTVGEGAVIKATHNVKAHLTTWFADDEATILDSSRLHCAPVEFVVTELIDGMVEGMKGMKVGGRRYVWCPSEQAYGDKPKSETNVPKGSDMVFDITVMEILATDD